MNFSGLGRWRRGEAGEFEEFRDEGGDEDGEMEIEKEVWDMHVEMHRMLVRMVGTVEDAEAANYSIQRLQALGSYVGCEKVESAQGIARDMEALDGEGFLADGTSVRRMKHWLYLREDFRRWRELLGFSTMEFLAKSFADRIALLRGTDCRERLVTSKAVLEPAMKALGAKAAIMDALN